MPSLTILGTTIDFPNSSASPNWAPAVIQFAQLVEEALSIAIGTYDKAPQSFVIDSFNGASDVEITNLSFPISNVRAVFIRYSVFRTTSLETAYEAGDLIAVYNANNSINEKWTLSRGNITGAGGLVTFKMTDNGQITFDSTAMSGSSHAGRITFDARALEQS